MGWKVDGRHVAPLQHPLIIHNAVILTAVAASGMKEQDFLVSRARLLIEHFAPPPCWSRNICISTNNVIVITQGFFIGWCGTNECVMEEFKYSAPYMCPVRS